jgi:phytoene desaturase
MQAAIERFVRSPHLRQLLGRFATYVGASPFLAPATLNVIAHVELNGGVWYPRRGIFAIAAALHQVAQELGVEVRTGVRVEQILVENQRAQGVRLSSGDEISARCVIANLDVARVYESLLPAGAVPASRVARLTGLETSCSGFAMLLGVAGEYPELAHHNIFFSSDYRKEFSDIFQRGIPPEEPTIYLAITSKTDPDHAPPGHENWFVLINVPSLNSQFDWQQAVWAYRDCVLARLSSFGYDIRGNLECERLLTPLDLEQLTGARRGALYGLSSNPRMAAFRRPHNRCREVAGLYFAGGTTHPGGGVPMVILSGKVAAGLALADGFE